MTKKINGIITFLAITVYTILCFHIDFEFEFKQIDYSYILILPFIILYINSIFNKDEKKKYLKFYFIIYIVFVIALLFQTARVNDSTIRRILQYENNYIPFKSMYTLLTSVEGISYGVYNIVGNFLIFTPLAIFLPFYNSNLKKTKEFLTTLVIIILFVEIAQLIFEVNSFDIDDIILNILGAYSFHHFIYSYNLDKYVNKIFLDNNLSTENEVKYKKNKRDLFIIYYASLITFIIVISHFSHRIFHAIYIPKNTMTPDFSNLVCENDKKNYLGDYENYHIYSKCEYKNNEVKLAYRDGFDQYVLISSFVNSSLFKEKYIKELDLIKEPIITNMKLIKNNSNKRELIASIDSASLCFKKNYYFYNLDDILITQDKSEYSLKKYLQTESVDRTVSLKYMINAKIVFTVSKNSSYGEKTDYFNTVTCRKQKYAWEEDIYYLPKDFKLNKNTCKYLTSLE